MEKVKNLPVMRVVAIAVVIAIVFGLSAVMMSYTASAEDSTSTADDVVSQLGTLGNYDCIKFKAGQKIDFMTLYNRVQALSSTYVNGAIFGYKDGKFTSFTNNSFLVRPSTNGAYYDFVFCSNVIYGAWLLGDKSVYDTAYAQFGLFQSNYCGMWVGVKDNEPTILGATKLAASPQDFYDANGEIMYLVFTGSNNVWSSQDSKDFRNDIVNNLTDRDYKDIDTGNEPSAEFLSFKGTGSSGLYLIDWVTAGQQYPIVDFRIDDNGNYHKYALRISGNSNYAEILKGIWDRQEIKEASSAALNGVGVLLLLKTALSLGTKAVVSIAGASTPIGALFLNVPTKDVAGYVMLAAQNKLVQEYDTLSYDNIRTLSSETMNFSEGSTTVSKAVSLCLSDYVSVVPNTLYKLEIIDVTESKLLDVAYFSSRRGYTQSDSGYGTVVSDYDNKNDLDNDIDNNNGYSNGNKNNGDKFASDNPYDIIKNNNEFYSQLDISNIFGSLQSSASSLGSFFQACMSIIPAGILAVIIGGLSIVIILRILGR